MWVQGPLRGGGLQCGTPILINGTVVCLCCSFFSMSHMSNSEMTVSEIRLLFCALTGCTSHKTVHPEIASCTLPIYSNNKWLKKRAQIGCTLPIIVHPALEMCTPAAGCTLNDYVPCHNILAPMSHVSKPYMSHVQFKKCPCRSRSVEFRCQGP